MKSLLLPPSFASPLTLALGTTVLSGAAWAQSAADGKALYQKTFVAGARTCLSCHLAPRDDAVMLRGANANAIKAATQAVPQMARLHGAITDTEFNHLARYIADEYQTAPTFIAVTATPPPRCPPQP